MSRSCLNCKHCYKKEYCTLTDELIKLIGCCWMWSEK